MSEQRLVFRLQKYWSHLRKKASQGGLPNISAFDNRIISDIQPLCLELKVIASASSNIRYQYMWVGKKIIEIFGYDPTMRALSEDFASIPGGAIIEQIDKAIRSGKLEEPIEVEGDIDTPNGVIKYRSCALPFANSIGGGVTDVIVGTSWKTF